MNETIPAPAHEAFMYRCQTRGIDVLVLPQFMADQSRPEESHFFWAYTIEIVNRSDRRVQLRSRHWIITDGNGVTSELHGAGVVGEQPVLEPGGSFRYTSGCPLTTPSGIMRGFYHIVAEDGTEFDVEIPAFSLDSPFMKRVIH